MRFQSPFYLLLFIGLGALIYYQFLRKRPAIKYSDLTFFKKVRSSARYKGFIPLVLNLLVLFFVILALARPQKGRIYEEVESKGVDIILCLDISTSMLAEDFTPRNRLYVAKEQAKKFIEKRPGDRIGLVVFAADAISQCPLTLDHKIVEQLIDYVHTGIVTDGTAIGMGLATAVARLRDSRAKNKLIILLTDGRNNAGEIDPLSAAKLARTLGIKVYCIGVGSKGPVRYPVNDPVFGRRYVQARFDLDMDILNEIARTTQGRAFLATDARVLKTIYDEIDKLEPTTFKVTRHTLYSEKAGLFMLPATIIMLINLFLGLTFLRRLP